MSIDPLDFLFDTAYHTYNNNNNNSSDNNNNYNNNQNKKNKNKNSIINNNNNNNKGDKNHLITSQLNLTSNLRKIKHSKDKKKVKKRDNVKVIPISSSKSGTIEERAFLLSNSMNHIKDDKNSPKYPKLFQQYQQQLFESIESPSSNIKKSHLRNALEFSKTQSNETFSSEKKKSISEQQQQQEQKVQEKVQSQEQESKELSEHLLTIDNSNLSNTLLNNSNKITIGFSNHLSNLPEWTCLRDNYIQQLHSLESHESIACQKGLKTEISIPNFISLLLALRKISCRIAFAYQIALKDKNTQSSVFVELQTYVYRMVNDMACINRPPFINWLGIVTVYNPFLSSKKIDGTSALLRFDRRSSIGVQIHQDKSNNDNITVEFSLENVEIRPELRMTESEQEFINDLSETIWSTYKKHLDAIKYRKNSNSDQYDYHDHHPENNHDIDIDSYNGDFEYNGNYECNNNQKLMELKNVSADNAVERFYLGSNKLSSHQRIKQTYWNIWRKRFVVRVGLRNIQQGRERCYLRQVLDVWINYVWQSIQFKKLQNKRCNQLLVMTFQGWLQYLYWCRRFNKVLQHAIRENQRRILMRMHLFAKRVYQNRNFKKMRAMMPLVITFRALKQNALINRFQLAQKLKSGTTFLFSDLQLRILCFNRWKEVVKFGRALETIDVSLLVCQLRSSLQTWKIKTWPEKYNIHSKSSRFLKSITSAMISSFQEPNNTLFQNTHSRVIDNIDSNDEISSQFSFDTKSSVKKGWLSYALGSSIVG